MHPEQVFLVDDMSDLDDIELFRCFKGTQIWTNIHRNPWRLGVAHSFNVGVARSVTDLVITLGADDKLKPNAVRLAYEAWRREKHLDAYYAFGVEYSDGRLQQEPCGAAMVTKELWRMTGGFPVEVSTGASDAALMSILLTHFPDRIVPVDPNAFPYWYRVHEESDTSRLGPWQGVILETRNVVTKTWEKPAWGRN
jgi:glycosyltransferase involved in cell wall biosynthesis